jgi:hypothetical protein
MNCEFCNKVLSSKWALKTHKETAKYCLSIQEKTEVAIKQSTFTCERCLRDFCTTNKSRHMKRCNSSISKIKEQGNEITSLKEIALENVALKEQVKQLQTELRLCKEFADRDAGRLFEIAKQPKTTNNKTTNKVSILTPLDLSAERLKELVEANFTNSHLLEGQKGVARFTVEHVIKDENGKLQYICTDPARHTFRFKEGDTEIKDIRGKRLSSALAPPVMDKTGRLGMQAIKENPDMFCVYSDSQQSIRDMRDDDAEFRGELASMVT